MNTFSHASANGGTMITPELERELRRGDRGRGAGSKCRTHASSISSALVTPARGTERCPPNWSAKQRVPASPSNFRDNRPAARGRQGPARPQNTDARPSREGRLLTSASKIAYFPADNPRYTGADDHRNPCAGRQGLCTEGPLAGRSSNARTITSTKPHTATGTAASSGQRPAPPPRPDQGRRHRPDPPRATSFRPALRYATALAGRVQVDSHSNVAITSHPPKRARCPTVRGMGLKDALSYSKAAA